MTCDQLERWLNEGMPESLAEQARAHARACARCAASLAAALELETMLASPPCAPEAFTERVMVRLEAPSFAPAAPALPWWIRAASEPAAVAALALAAAVLWGWQRLWTLAETLAPAVARVASAAVAWVAGLIAVPRFGSLAKPQPLLGIELALLCLALLASPALYRATLRLAVGAFPERARWASRL